MKNYDPTERSYHPPVLFTTEEQDPMNLDRQRRISSLEEAAAQNRFEVRESGAQRRTESAVRGKRVSPRELRPPSDSAGPSGTIAQAGTGWYFDDSPQEVTPHPTTDSGSDGENEARHEPAGASMESPKTLAGYPLARRVDEMEY